MFGAREPSLPPLPEPARAWLERLQDLVALDRLRTDLEALPGPRNRLNAAEAMERTDALLLTGFREAGWQADLRRFEERDVLGYADHGDFTARVRYERLAGANVVAVKEGEEPDALVVVAHHDTVRDTPGADDNGAGLVALLELARVLAPMRFRRTVVLAAVDMEEIGLYGSQHLVRELLAERPPAGALVFETMAYTSSEPGSQTIPPGLGAVYVQQVRRIRRRAYRGDFTALIYRDDSVGLASWFGAALREVAGPDAALFLREPTDLPMIGGLLRRTVPFVRNFSRSDHVVFWVAGIPALWITDTANFRNPHYHLPSDTPHTVDHRRLAALTVAAAFTLIRHARLVDAGGA